MLHITIPEREIFNDKTNEFINIKETELCLEHSLVSLSKWESKWHKPFLDSNEVNKPKSREELVDYVRCMCITQNVDPQVFYCLSEQNYIDINSYINDPMTATTITEHSESKKRNKEILTSELIYYWMITLQIPFECQKWHLNRLLMLIRVCNLKNSPGKKMSNREIMSSNKALNEARRKQLHSKG